MPHVVGCQTKRLFALVLSLCLICVQSPLLSASQAYAAGESGGSTPSAVSDTDSASTPFDNSNASLPSSGDVKVLAINVSFADKSFAEGDSLDALNEIFNGAATAAGDSTDTLTGDLPAGESTDLDGDASTEAATLLTQATFPYESLSAYYNRASYGKLDITADVYEYASPKNRSDYSSQTAITDLFSDVLSALVDQIDFTQYDFDNDGYLDGVYIHFAGEDTGWGTTWWSQVAAFTSDAAFDGKMLKSVAMLHLPSNHDSAANTLIHETGHLLGMPDLYSYAKSEGEVIDYRTGTLTYDMMENDYGDINAYFKWILGWIDESQITRIAVSKNGCRVMRGGVLDSATYDSIDCALASFANNGEGQSGGFVAISNNESIFDTTNGLYSDFFLLEYETFAGNSSVTYSPAADEVEQIPNAFRLYQIRGVRDSLSGIFVHNNFYGTPGNKLIELVDYDCDKSHSFNTSFDVADDGVYGCVLTAGAMVGPSTSASTNIGGSLVGGFTGINIEVISTQDNSGVARISYEEANLPDPDTFTITLNSDQGAVLNSGVIKCTSTFAAQYFSTSAEVPVYMQVGDAICPLSVAVDECNIELSYCVSPGVIGVADSAKIVFTQGVFQIGVNDAGEAIYSPEITLDVDLASTVGFEASDYYEGSDDTLNKSDAFELGASTDGSGGSSAGFSDTSLNYFRLTSGGLYLDTLGADGASIVASSKIDGVSADFCTKDTYSLSVAVLGESRVGVYFKSENDPIGTFFEIDTLEKSVATGSSCTVEDGAESIFTLGNTAACLYKNSRSGISAIYLLDGSSLSERPYIMTRAYSVFDAGEGYLALCSTPTSNDGYAIEIALYDSSQVKALVYERGGRGEDDIFTEGDSAGDSVARYIEDYLTPVMSFNYNESVFINDVKVYMSQDNLPAGVYVFGKSKNDGTADITQACDVLSKFDTSGALLAGLDVSTKRIDSYDALKTSMVVSDTGAIALNYVNRYSMYTYRKLPVQETILINSDFEMVGAFTDVSDTFGAWLPSTSKWLSLGFAAWRTSGGSGGSVGAPVTEGLFASAANFESSLTNEASVQEGDYFTSSDDSMTMKVHYALTASIDASNGGGDDGGDSDGDNPGGDNSSSAPASLASLASTGDVAGFTFPIFIILALVATTVLLCRNRASRRQQ